MNPQLIIFSGPPGVGKSSLSYRLAQQTHWTLLTKDVIERSLEKKNTPITERPSVAYEILLDSARMNLRQSTSVILDAVFGNRSIQDSVRAVALDCKAELSVIQCSCSSVAVWKQRIESRPQVVDGWTPADWEEVQRVNAYYQPWDTDALLLDAVHPLEENFKKTLHYVKLP